ncbi:hypothetical protein FIBSPDRAFT_881418 [Athelia psychrophila]|uniref:Uncharacterized protein n=1 Tax=Athelia psychrophila TaxID=1759441 RepID=A0A166WN88_9AGAM|nr:hypothetical protein FIBSPDRAFT_881418 [Fibularhizoctonia sp. CBS 109695]
MGIPVVAPYTQFGNGCQFLMDKGGPRERTNWVVPWEPGHPQAQECQIRMSQYRAHPYPLPASGSIAPWFSHPPPFWASHPGQPPSPGHLPGQPGAIPGPATHNWGKHQQPGLINYALQSTEEDGEEDGECSENGTKDAEAHGRGRHLQAGPYQHDLLRAILICNWAVLAEAAQSWEALESITEPQATIAALAGARSTQAMDTRQDVLNWGMSSSNLDFLSGNKDVRASTTQLKDTEDGLGARGHPEMSGQ